MQPQLSQISQALESGEVDALLFDLDGVLTPTSDLHRRAWREMFSPVLEEHGATPYTEDDYFAHLDGRQRMDGVRGVLESRGIELAEGGPGQDSGALTIYSLAEQKNEDFNRILAGEGMGPYPGTARFLEYAAGFPGVKMAVVSSSKNAAPILQMAGLASYFDAVVDGTVAAREGLPGKPAPDTFVRAAGLLGTVPSKSIVFEDAISGVAAGRAGHFAHVVGVDRGAGAAELKNAGATMVVADLDELVPGDPE